MTPLPRTAALGPLPLDLASRPGPLVRGDIRRWAEKRRPAGPGGRGGRGAGGGREGFWERPRGVWEGRLRRFEARRARGVRLLAGPHSMPPFYSARFLTVLSVAVTSPWMVGIWLCLAAQVRAGGRSVKASYKCWSCP